jgi:PIN domain nuclease of toxin-antitoxin system
VLWELAKLVQLGRIQLDLADAGMRRALASVHGWPIILEVVVASTQLDVRGDAADELIAATSLVHGVPLVTRDRDLRASKLVPLASTRGV